MHPGKFLFSMVALSLLSACSAPVKESEPVVSVQIVPAKRDSIGKVIVAEAVLFPLQQASLTPKISAPIKRFYVNRGAHVKAGQLLATLENRDLAAAQIETKGALAQAEAVYATSTASGLPEEFHKAELDLESAKQAFEAEQKLFDSRQDLYKQGALPRKDLDQSRVTLAQAKSQYEIAQQHWNALQGGGKEQALKSVSGQLQSARGKYEGSAAQLSYSEIRSPITGIVAERAAYPGEIATAGSPLMVVMDTSAIIAKAHVPEQDAALLKFGDPAELSVPGIDESIPAGVTVVSPATDANSTTVEIWMQVSNNNQQLRPGTTARISITAQTIHDALIVPASALLNQPEGGTAVMVVGIDNRAHLRSVQTGLQQGNEIQILSGVQVGDKVVAAGAYGLPDNSLVKVEPISEPSKQKTAPGTKE